VDVEYEIGRGCAYTGRSELTNGVLIHSVIGAVPNAAFLAGHPMKLGTGACVSDNISSLYMNLEL
jgi:hypothetical protein